MTDTMTSQNIDLSSWDALYIYIYKMQNGDYSQYTNKRRQVQIFTEILQSVQRNYYISNHFLTRLAMQCNAQQRYTVYQ